MWFTKTKVLTRRPTIGLALLTASVVPTRAGTIVRGRVERCNLIAIRHRR